MFSKFKIRQCATVDIVCGVFKIINGKIISNCPILLVKTLAIRKFIMVSI